MEGMSFKVGRSHSLAGECCWVLQQPSAADRFGQAAEPVLHGQCGQGLQGYEECAICRLLEGRRDTQKTMPGMT